ncbi:aspartyl/asparaginyl beta-hydroxylase domain-containing protein [Chitinimonas koreensis]|uniref:aspartyl/asparaginyl beta-hydroxylase domain-containing protein n=1 Tax=Chitinimonas koreensis TaxID=356302 RepID=UPI000414CC7F|nr:aspartyl/asparaginyl beta-hydroxylase domain-containing protein [Chitinimonas koreensis]QNM95571.1 aspartyl/asparaginyl beta-hydroxylase domain-containing protein [Chitinimonas koreensis]
MLFELPPFARLPLRFDAAALRAALDVLPQDAWQPHFNTGYYQGDWSGIALTAPADAVTPLSPGQGEGRPTAHCDDFWREQLGRLQTRLRSARLLRLGPGGSIAEHRDYDLGQPGADLRLHVPIVTDEAVEFLLDGRMVPMAAGECWFLDLSRPHRVDNHGGQARIHLVLDCSPSPWLAGQIEAGLADTPPARDSRGAQAFAEFRGRVQADAALTAELAAHTDHETFAAAVLAHATAAGLRFSRADLDSAMTRGRREWIEQWIV